MQHIPYNYSLTHLPHFSWLETMFKTKLKAQNLVKRHLNFKRWIPAFFLLWIEPSKFVFELTKLNLKLTWRSWSCVDEVPRSPTQHPACSCPAHSPGTWWQNWYLVPGGKTGLKSGHCQWTTFLWLNWCFVVYCLTFHIFDLFYMFAFSDHFALISKEFHLPQTIIPCRDNDIALKPLKTPLPPPETSKTVLPFHFSVLGLGVEIWHCCQSLTPSPRPPTYPPTQPHLTTKLLLVKQLLT